MERFTTLLTNICSWISSELTDTMSNAVHWRCLDKFKLQAYSIHILFITSKLKVFPVFPIIRICREQKSVQDQRSEHSD